MASTTVSASAFFASRRLHQHNLETSDETEYYSVSEVVPLKVSLESLRIGPWLYTSTTDEEIELSYEMQSTELKIRANAAGNTGAPPAVFSIRDVSAADLQLVSVVPGSLESMVARLVLETESDVSCEELGRGGGGGGETRELRHRMVTLTASPHEAGSLRDILFFQKSPYSSASSLSTDSLYLSPRRSKKAGSKEESSPPQEVVIIDGLPFWTHYIPWWVYSRRVRQTVQFALLLYMVFSVMWAMWQLYRHVHIIRVALKPIINLLWFHLASLMEVVDGFLAWFTELWTTLLSPLNVFRGIVIAPLLTLLGYARSVSSFVFYLCNAHLGTLWRAFCSSSLLTALRAFASLLRAFASVLCSSVWNVLFSRPLYAIWRALLNSRVAVASLDLNRARLNWVFGLVTGSVRAIGVGLTRLFGYTRTKQKQLKALKGSQPGSSHSTPVKPPSCPPLHKPTTKPIMYHSPLTKQPD